MLRPTLRVNGRRMFTTRTAHHLGGTEVARLLCGYAEQAPAWWRDFPGADMTRAQVEELVRDMLHLHGVDAYADERFDEDARAEHCYQVVAWAYGQVRRLLPELVDADLDAWVSKWRNDARPDAMCPNGCGRLDWVDDQYRCPHCEDEWHPEHLAQMADERG